jgi:hypothetical protein
MCSTVLFADDIVSVTETIRDFVIHKRIQGVKLVCTVREAIEFLEVNRVARAIADWLIVGSKRSGIDILEFAAKTSPAADLYLISGHNRKEIGDDGFRRLEAIGAKFLDKYDCDANMLESLLRYNTQPILSRRAAPSSVDPLEKIAKYALEENRNAELSRLVKEVTVSIREDIKRYLKKVKDPNIKRLFIGEKALSAEDMLDHLELMDDIGIEMVRAHNWILSVTRK